MREKYPTLVGTIKDEIERSCDKSTETLTSNSVEKV